MSNNQTNQRGFGVIEVIIILVVVGLVGFGGWYVWKKNSDKKSKEPATSQQKTEPSANSDNPKEADPTDGWVAYSNAPGKFSFKYPASWVKPDNPEACTETLILLAPNQNALGKCASEHMGQIAIASEEGDTRSNHTFDKSYYKSATDEAVTVAGVTGKKLTATVSGMEAEVFVGAWPDNTKLVQYLFFTNGRTYIATYAQEPTYPDALADFNLLITKTFKFSS